MRIVGSSAKKSQPTLRTHELEPLRARFRLDSGLGWLGFGACFFFKLAAEAPVCFGAYEVGLLEAQGWRVAVARVCW